MYFTRSLSVFWLVVSAGFIFKPSIIKNENILNPEIVKLKYFVYDDY